MYSVPSAELCKVVTIVFPEPGGERSGVCPLEYKGLALQHYLRAAPLLPYALIGRVRHGGARNRSGQRVRLTYIPPPGDVVAVGFWKSR